MRGLCAKGRAARQPRKSAETRAGFRKVPHYCANIPELFSSVKFLTTGIVAEFPYSSGLHREALFAIGLVLFVFIMIINLILNGILKKGGKKEKAAKTAGKA